MKYLITGSNRINVVISGKPYVAEVDHPNYRKLVEAIKNDDEAMFLENIDIPLSIERSSGGKVTVKNGVVQFNGVSVHNTLANRIIEFINKGLPFQPLLNFLENLMANPSKRAVDELYPFLEYTGIVITEDGHFVAYKGLRPDYRDIHSGQYLNTPGTINEMPRNNVDDDCDRGCSYGFHVGTFEYANSFRGPNGQLVLCKVNPADVVSVPKDCSCQKVRTCRYEVLEDCTGRVDRPLFDGYDGEDDVWEDDPWEDYVDDEEGQESCCYDGVCTCEDK